jgi:uncharacterized integral membrane protein (TIGR00698 family)
MNSVSRFLLPIGAVVCLFPFVSSGLALVFGAALSLSLGNPWIDRTRRLTPKILSLSVIGLGAGMNLNVVAEVGFHGIGYTVVGIVLTGIIGALLGRALKVDANTSILTTVGTAICGGSAIAAAAPTINAKAHEITVALATVFLLNAAALFIFPFVGHALDLSQIQFGYWSALAIHDTSSVVGASMQFGSEALKIATTVKLARALWIVPVSLFTGYLYSRRQIVQVDRAPAKRPWFIAGFLLMAALMTWFPALQPAGVIINLIAKKMLVVTLFLIGANLTRSTLAAVGFRPLIQGVLLWAFTASASLAAILLGWVK